MLTAGELAELTLFSSLSDAALRDLSKAAADIHLEPGDYAVHEGDEPALYVVLSGQVDITKLIDGVEKTIGKRLPGVVFGEIPLVYGTPFQSSARAAVRTRILRLAPRQYHAVAAASPEIARTIAELAKERMSGLQGIAAMSHGTQVMVVGRDWDPASSDLRRFLSRNQVAFDWLTPDDPQLTARWIDPPVGECPAVRLPDGTTLVRPDLRTLARSLHLDTQPRESEYDTVIVGAGPAGLAAAVYGASEGLRTLVVEREAPGGQAGTSSRIENYLGFPNGISGDELASRALRQAKRLGAEILITRSVAGIDLASRSVILDGGDSVRTRSMILATGVNWRRVPIEGFDRLIGKGIYYGAARSEAGVTQGLDVHLIGAGNSAGQAAMFFANHARTVTLLVRGDSLEKSMSQYLIDQIRRKANIKVALRSEVQAVHGSHHLEGIDIVDHDAKVQRREESGGLFVFIGADAETDWLPDDIARDQRGYILTGNDLLKEPGWSERWFLTQGFTESYRQPFMLETSVPGIFAAGDVRRSTIKRCASAVGEGSMAIAFTHQYFQLSANA
ncbi:MAG: FAD-dependent oxidoreductase [Bauldia sp.]|nr:FAD-dependent oxidoreductase [Bauldia sp.]